MKQVLILLSIFILWGCSNTSEPQEIPDVDQTNSLIPLRVGNYWEYSERQDFSNHFIDIILKIFPDRIYKKIIWNEKTMYLANNGYSYIYNDYYNSLEVYDKLDGKFYRLIYFIPCYKSEYPGSRSFNVLVHSYWDEIIFAKYEGYSAERNANEYKFYRRNIYEPYQITDSCSAFFKDGVGLVYIHFKFKNLYYEYRNLIDYKVNP